MEERVYNPQPFSWEDLNDKVGIYQISNLVNGHFYIGSSCDLSRRCKKHRSLLRCGKHVNSHLQNAFNKYGEENFVFELIELCDAESRLDIEQYWIDKYFSKDYFYNVEPKASSGHVLSDRRRLCNGKEHTGKPVVCLESGIKYKSIIDAERKTGIFYKNIIKCCKGKGYVTNNTHWMYEEDYNKLSSSEIENLIHCNVPYKSVVCLETEQVYKSISQASKITGGSASGIKECCENVINTTGGFHWMYYKDYINATKEEVELKKLTTKNCYGVRSCVCLETGKQYSRLIDAENELNIPHGKLQGACSGSKRTVGGYHWMYEEDYLKLTKEDIEKIINNSDKRRKQCVCLETGRIFNSFRDAADYFGVHKNYISSVCLGKKDTVKNCHLMFKTNYDKLSKNDIDKIINRKHRRRDRRCICLENNKIYDSLKDAGLDLNLKSYLISAVCKGKRNHTGGYHFKYVDYTLKF